MDNSRHALESVAECMPAAVLQSSRGRCWLGVEVMVARITDNLLEVDYLPTHTIAINVGRPFRLKGRVDGRAFSAAMAMGALKVVEAGPRSRWRWDRGEPIDMLHISVSADALRAHARELEVRFEPEIFTRVGFNDEHLLRVGQAFAGELCTAAARSLTSEALRIELLLRLLVEHSSVAGTNALRLPTQRLGVKTLRLLDDYIDAHLGDDIGIADLAALAGVSRFHFARMFKVTAGVTPYRYVLERRVDRAHALLLQSPLSISDIAAATGFADQSHFTRHVKRRFGYTPSAHRASSTNLLDGPHPGTYYFDGAREARSVG